MKLSESYNKTILEEFWNVLEAEMVVESNGDLDSLITKADELIFEKFKIEPNERKYCIVGSARLYLYPKLRDAFGLSSSIGDLDLVIPNKQDWVNADLIDNWNSGGIYRPTNDGSVEAFNVWDPSKAGGEYADVKVRSTSEVIRNATQVNGYFFMSLFDIVDYKMSMNREKEQDIVKLISSYQKSGTTNKIELLRRMAKIIGLDATKEFLGKM